MTTTNHRNAQSGGPNEAGGMQGSESPASPEPRRKPGPESLCTPELTEKVCEKIRRGVPQKYACPAVGLNWHTARDWNRLGRQGKEPYASVWTPAIKEAYAQHVATCVEAIMDAGADDAKHLEWLLERRYREFMKPEHRKVEITGKDGGPIQTASTDELVALIRSTEDVTD